MKTFPKCGHPRTASNERIGVRRDNPLKTFAQCRACKANSEKLKYRNDNTHREKMKTDRLAAYHARKEQPQCRSL